MAPRRRPAALRPVPARMPPTAATIAKMVDASRPNTPLSSASSETDFSLNQTAQNVSPGEITPRSSQPPHEQDEASDGEGHMAPDTRPNHQERIHDLAVAAVSSSPWSALCSPNNLLDTLLTDTVHLLPNLYATDERPSLADWQEIIIENKNHVKKPKVKAKNTLNLDLPPMSNIEDIFEDIAKKATDESITGHNASILDLVKHLNGHKLRLGTMCSGTESPVLAMNMILSALQRLGHETFDFEHVFSCEIEAFKQSYIERNFNPPILFRDARDFIKSDGKAMSVYNAEHDIPGKLDILVAGFSCKDFSNLNTRKKTLASNGESGQTFQGIKAYCEKYRPKIVVLENIQGCEWEEVKRHYRETGYFAEHVLVDTKNYYLPQTRNRGYMVAFDAGHEFFQSKSESRPPDDIDAAESNASQKTMRPTRKTKATKGKVATVDTTAHDIQVPGGLLKNWAEGQMLTKEWARMLKDGFKRPASSPFFEFLMPDDDDKLLSIKQRLSHEGSLGRGARTVDWVACRGRHQGERIEKHLGFERPITMWQNNGSSKVRDHIWINWAKRQQERVLDTLDISFLRKVQEEDLDINYKTRIIELSQNVDREIDRRSPGVVSCLLPSGQPFITTRGGILTGRESLALQGLPVNDMIITRESNAELQDLAGNAMSSTVVGCAVLSALLAGRPLLSITPQQKLDDWLASNKLNFGNRFDYCSDDDSGLTRDDMKLKWLPLTDDDVSMLGREAAKSMQYCPCEGNYLLKSDRAFVLCDECGETRCAKCKGNPRHSYNDLPLRILVERIAPVKFESLLREKLPAVIELSGLALEEIDIFQWLAQSKVAKNFPQIVDYLGHLDLQENLLMSKIERRRNWTVTWESTCLRLQLLIKPQRQRSVAGSFSWYFGRSKFEWLLYIKSHPREPLASKLSERLALPYARLRPKHSLLDGMWEIGEVDRQDFEICITNIGTGITCWEAQQGLPTLEKANTQLHVEVRVGKGSLTLPHEIRSINGSYRLLQNCGTAMGCLHKRIPDKSEFTPSPEVFLFLDHGYLTEPEEDSFVFATQHGRLNYPEQRVVIGALEPSWRPKDSNGAGDKRTVKLRALHYSSHPGMKLIFPTIRLERYVPHVQTDLLLVAGSCHAAKITLLKYQVILKHEDSRNWAAGQRHNLRILDNPQALSFSSFLKPHLDITTPGWIQVPHDNIVGCADRCDTCAPAKPEIKLEEWTNFRNQTVQKPMEDKQETKLWEARMKGRPSALLGELDCGKKSYVRIEANLTTLAHRALAALLDMGAMSQDGSNISSISWRIIKEESIVDRLDFGKLTIRGNQAQPDQHECRQPPGFCNPIDPQSSKYLRPEQLLSLQWMKDREVESGPHFEHIAVQEAPLRALDSRLEVKVTARRRLLGGIVAHEVGYGKTAIVLGLIDSTYNSGMALDDHHGFISTAATLIVVPNIILSQWVGEMAAFLRWSKAEILVIDNGNRLPSLEQVKAARCVLVGHNVLNSDSYHEQLRKATDEAGSVPARDGRAYDFWMKQTMAKLGVKVNNYKREREVTNVSGEEYIQTGSNGKRKPSTQTTLLAGRARKTARLEVLPAMLQAFHFRRIVVDEYTYLEKKGRQMAQKLSGRLKWIVSGTPDLSNFASVNEMACFLGVRLGLDDDRQGLYKDSGGLDQVAKDRSIFEDFQSYQINHSIAWHRQRHDHAQAFLDEHARQDKAEIDKIHVEEHYQIVHLNPTERFFYAAVFHHLMSRDMTCRQEKGRTDERTLEAAVTNLIKESKHGLEALIRSCSTLPEVAVDCEDMIKSKSRELMDTVYRLLNDLRRAFYLEESLKSDKLPPKNLFNFLQCVGMNAYGDDEAMKWLRKLLFFAKENPLEECTPNISEKPKKSKSKVLGTNGSKSVPARKPKVGTASANVEPQDDSDVNELAVEADQQPREAKQKEVGAQEELKHRVNAVIDLTLDFVEHIRAIRQFAAISKCISSPNDTLNCEACNGVIADHDQALISLVCGHVLCKTCFTKSNDKDRVCPISGCNGGISESSFVTAAQYAHQRGEMNGVTTSSNPNASVGLQTNKSRCSKLDAVLQLLQHDVRLEPDDKIVIFVQYEKIAEELEAALEAENITHVSIQEQDKETKETARLLSEFQEITKGVRVCILRIESCSSAGINLQCANHVVFMSTLIKTSEQAYLATMVQAIGRAARFGQKKKVHVWHMLAAHTVDVNIFQSRQHGALVEGHPVRLVKGDCEGTFSGANLETSLLEMGDLVMD